MSPFPVASLPRVLAIGHRGAAAHVAENTIPSFERALALGADALEFDVALSKDGVAVVIHDDTLERTTDGRGEVEAHTFEQLRRLDAGSWKGEATLLPSLAEVLDAFAPRTLLNLEIKESRRRVEIVEACLGAVAERGALGAVVFSSFDLDALRLLRALSREARIGVLCTATDLEAAFVCARDVEAENLHPPVIAVTPSLVARAHDAGLRVWTWTANDAATIARLVGLGVDGIFSDLPERVVEARSGKSSS